MKKHWIRSAVAIGVGITLAASCASSEGESGNGGDSGGSGSDSSGEVRGVTDDTITIGSLSEAKTYTGIDKGAEARFERANRDGGIHGRTIEFVGLKDDGQDAGRNLDQARQLVDADGVFAVAPVVSQYFLPQSSDYLAQNEVPFVGWGFMPGFCDNEYGFGFNGCLIGQDYVNTALVDPVIAATGKEASELKVAIQTGDDAAGKSGAAQYKTVLEDRGAEIVYQESTISTANQTTDYSPFVQAVLASDPDLVYASARFADVLGFTGAMRQAGFEGPIVNFVGYVPGLLEAQPPVAQALEGSWVNSQIPPSESDSPAIDQIHEDLEAIGEDPFISLGGALGYWSADVLVQQLEAAGEDLTPEAFQKAMEDFTYEPMDGGIGPVSFPMDKTAPTPCAAIVGIKGGAYDVLEPMDCYETLPTS